MGNVNESELAASVAERLEELGFSVHAPGPSDVEGQAPHLRPDLLASRFEEGLCFIVEVKAQAPNVVQARGRAAQWTGAPGRCIFAFPHVTAGEGARFRAQDLNYIDSGGNAWIEAPGLTLWIEGRKPAYVRRAGSERPSRAFRPVGLRAVFALLSEPRLQNASLRELAAASGISLGAASNTLADLKETAAMGEVRGRRVLSDPDQLRETWIEHYGATLRPTLEERRVEGPAPGWWTTSEATDILDRTGMQLGGESALAAQGHGLRAGETVLYGDPPWRDVVRQLRMPMAARGNVILRERFWDPAAFGGGRAVPPLLVLADAMISGDERQIEIARRWDSGIDGA